MNDRVSTSAVYVNATVLTQDPAAPRAEALAVVDGRITAVGTSSDIESLIGPDTKRIDLDGRVLLPGFNDAHAHVWKAGQLLTSILDLRSVRSLDELCYLVRQRHRELPLGTWVIGRGYNEALMREGRQPTRHDLDAAAMRRPVALTRTCGHMMVVSTRALELAGIDRNTNPPAGGIIAKDEHGEPIGLLEEAAMGFAKAVMPDPSVDDYAEMVLAANQDQLRKGITSVSEAGAYPDLITAYRKLDDEGLLAVRANVMAMARSDERLITDELGALPLPEKFVSDCLRVDSVKLFVDGGLSGASAALSRPYDHVETFGILRLNRDDLDHFARRVHDAGFRVCAHAIGDVAIDFVLTAYEKLERRGHRIEHFGLPDPSHLARASRLGAIVVPQAVFIHSLGPNFRWNLDDEFLARCYPIRSMLDAGLAMALSSDAPVVPDDDPFLGIQAAVTRRDMEGELIAPEESIRVDEALYAYTMGGAVASGDADNRGSLTVGKWADMVVVDTNPLEVAPENLAEIRVEQTFVADELVFSR